VSVPDNLKISCVGYEINADYYNAESDVILLNLIGYTSNIDKYQDFLSTLNKLNNLSVLTIDYTGHGKSPYEIGDLMPAQNFLEVVIAFDWIKDNYPEKKVYVMGASYGAFLATQLTKYRTFEKLVLRVPAIYKPENFYTKWNEYEVEEGRLYRATAEKLTDHPLLKRASSFKGKTFVVTHELDDVCPIYSTMAFASAFGADHWEAKGFKHGFGESDVTKELIQDYYKKVAEWLAR